MLRAELDAQVAVRVLRDLDRDMKKAIATDSKGIGDDLVAAIRSAPGVAPYQAVYRKLGQSARVRTRAGRPPEVVVGGAKKFSGGGTVNVLVRPYEYGAKTGDLSRGPGVKTRQQAPSRRRRGGRRALPQFPPASNEGLWVNAVCEAWEGRGTLLNEWLTIVDSVLAGIGSKDHG